MKIVAIGLRGFPGVQGGVEKHCEKLYTSLVKYDCDITVFTRKEYVNPDIKDYKGVHLIPVQCPRNKYLEAIVHTFKCVLKAKKLKPDILHIHAIGPSLFTPLARLSGMKVVVTHHGPDYKREKWQLPAKLFLKLCEMVGVRFANKVIAIADNIADDVRRKFGRDAAVIPNGVEIPIRSDTDETLKRYNLQKNRYILAVGRFVPEKGFDDLIEAFNELQVDTAERVPNLSFPDLIGESSIIKNQRPLDSRFCGNDTKTRFFHVPQVASHTSQVKDWKLVIVGDADHEDRYSIELKEKARKSRNVVLTGFQTGSALGELYSHAGLFVLPSFYEGLPIVLLEAMSYGLSCIVSDIPANRSIELGEDRFFKAGDTEAIVEKIKEFLNREWNDVDKKRQITRLYEKYNWEKIANETLKVYKSL